MDYQESIQYLESLAPTLVHPSLDRIETFLAEQGAPQDAIATLHVGGTNGKGSTVAVLDSILRAGGLRVARFTGPHLLRWNERFHVGGQPIEDDEFARQASRLRQLSEAFAGKHPRLGPLTWFEFLTALAFLYFVERKVDVAIFEVGLGGRFDATNVISKPLAVGITNVSLDHVHILGDTIEKIAYEKAGIIKRETPVVTAAESPGLEVIMARALEYDASLIHCSDQLNVQIAGDKGDLGALSEISRASKRGLRGVHQRSNLSVALEMLRSAGFLLNGKGRPPLSPAAIRRGLENVYWAGRFQVLPSANVVLDGAHNEAAAKALRASLDELFPGERIHFVFGCYANKDGLAMLERLLRSGDRLYAGEVELRRAVYDKAALVEFAERMGSKASAHDSIEEAFRKAMKERSPKEPVVVTGSFATIKSVVTMLGWTRVEDGLVKDECRAL